MIAGGSFFVDTNVLLYAHNLDDLPKRAAALDWLWEHMAGRVSWQVLVEFYSNAVRKAGLPERVARQWTLGLMEWNPEIPTDPMLQRAWHWCDSARINFWDAMIVAAAEQAGCRYLLSEDFQTGRKFDRLTVVNPFTERPDKYFG
jgi:predicted nucleic acid-binding protein